MSGYEFDADMLFGGTDFIGSGGIESGAAIGDGAVGEVALGGTVQ